MARGHIRDRSGPRGPAFEIRAYGGVDPATGKERRLTRTVRGTRKQAERELTRLLGELDEGAHAGPDTSFRVLLDRWVELKSARWSPTTTATHRGHIARHIVPALGDLRLSAITPARLDAFYGQLQTGGLKASTARRIASVVSSALGQAVRWDWLLRNPAARCEPIPLERGDIVPPASSDVGRLLVYLDENDPELALFVRLAAVTGRRRGELCALRWSDVDFDNGTVVVARTLAKAPHGWVERPISKNKRRFPPLALGPTTLGLLKSHRAMCAERLLAVGVALPADGFVFTAPSTSRRGLLASWTPDRVSRRFGAARAKVGLAGTRLHDYADIRVMPISA